jgi:hypothetical protein
VTNGLDIKDDMNIDQCGDLCNTLSDCLGFSFGGKNENTEKGTCRFRKKLHPMNNSNFVSFEKKTKSTNDNSLDFKVEGNYKILINTTIDEGGIGASENLDMNECKKVCNRNDECKGISFKPPQTYNDKSICYYRSIVKPVTNTGFISYEKKINNESINKSINGFNEWFYHNLTGDTLESVSDKTIKECQDKCNQNSNCKGFTAYVGNYPNKKGWCNLYKNSSPVPREGIIAYVKNI